MNSENKLKKIIVLGGGFGGLRAVLNLERKLKKISGFSITLIDRNNFHLFTPALYETATVFGLIKDQFKEYLKGSVSIPIAEVIKNRKIDFIQAEIEEINLKEKFVKTTGGNFLSFDYLVIALGGETEFFDIPGVREYAFNFKNVYDALAIYNKIQELYINYQKSDKSSKIRIAIIGGGFTGIELAGELSCCVKNIIKTYNLAKDCSEIFLFEAGPVILPFINEKQRMLIENRLKELSVFVKTNSQVIEVGPDFIRLKNNPEDLKFNLIIWAGGVRGVNLFNNLGLKLDQKGRIEVDEFLRAKISGQETNNDNLVWVIGDSANFLDPKTKKPIPAMAFNAYNQGKIAAENIFRAIQRKNLKIYKPFFDVWIAPVGGKWAYFHYKWIDIFGFLGYILRELVDLRYFITILPFKKAISLFFKDLILFTRND